MPVARRGEIWLIDLGYAAKTRPSVVLSVAFGDDDRAIVSFVPRPPPSVARATKCRTMLAGSTPGPSMLKEFRASRA